MKKVSMKARIEIIDKQIKKYRKASKKEKSQILNTICESTGLSRNRAKRLLSGSAVIKKKDKKKKDTRGRKIKYDNDFVIALEKIWHLMDFACGKRLKAGMKDMVEALERHDEMTFENDIKQKLFEISSSTIDKLLRRSKIKLKFKGKSTTKPGTLLKKNIPIRLGTEWDDAIPGYVEIDLVAHCGNAAIGEYANTLDVTDICTGWTETKATINKAQKHVFNALIDIENNMPFDYLGIDSDNGSEFINAHLYKYCNENNILFTRGRPNKKNDNCFVEQKNWAVVRKNVGYARYEGKQAVSILNEYYDLLRLYTNYFLPQTKLISKERKEGKIIKKYDIPKTPYQRVLDFEHIPNETKEKLKEHYLTLKPVSIKQKMIKTLEKLLELGTY